MKAKCKALIGAGLISMAASAMAMGPGQGGCGKGGGGGFQGRGLEMMEYALDLTTEQKAQIQALRDEHAAARGERGLGNPAALSQLDPSAADYQTQLDALAAQAADSARQRVYFHAEMQAKMREILTPEQLEKWQDMKSRMGKRGRGGWRSEADE
ncbi:Spy/CpxP family protein refolding chaperone [Teredinibacter turnerae]|uniref:Spy/CpxP family protein refolding chaperone n=1 Tax=Teredinibacter turnerae TaxID=2426 RepID=UPI000426BE54|nr:Spy/CpxP family protein refolding chaperone [Teredinibacter turnerae]